MVSTGETACCSLHMHIHLYNHILCVIFFMRARVMVFCTVVSEWLYFAQASYSAVIAS